MEEIYNKFYSSFDEAVNRFNKWDKSKTIQIISHLDADGISSCAILTKILNNENRKYAISILPQLNREKIEELKEVDADYFIFADFGSGQINDIKEIFPENEVIILDHHELEEGSSENITHINPHLCGVDGSKEISGSGVVYLFAKALDLQNKDLAHIAIIGAIGDVQENKGFLHLNTQILNDAVERGKIKIQKSLRLFGMQTRPIHKVLEYASDPYIPGVSGSESGAVQFLQQLGIKLKNGSVWRKVIDLNEEEMQTLVAGIIMKRIGEGSPEDVLGQSYILLDEEEGKPTRDAKEFSTLLNACGRMDKASFGIGACLGIKEDRKNALSTSSEYKKKIVESINWYRDNKDCVTEGEGFIIIDARDNVPATMIGTLASILSKSNEMKDGTYILSLARNDDGMTKVSIRVCGLREQEVDLREVVKFIVEKAGGEAGGHKYAAGALIETAKEKEFIFAAEEVFKQKV